MSSLIQVQLPQPCYESWDAMTPAGAGRHCAACQKVVIDFTAMTDGEVAAYLSRPAPLPCGRFRASQLDRPLLPVAAPVAGWRRWLGAVAALLGVGALVAPARAQAPQGTRPATAQQHSAPVTMGRPALPVAAKATCTTPTGQPAESLLLGEPMLTGAPRPIASPRKHPTRKKH